MPNCAARSLVSRPFWWPITTHGWPLKRQAADDRLVVGEGAVAMQFLEVGEDLGDVVQRVGPLRVARDLRHLPGASGWIDVSLVSCWLLWPQALDLVGDVDRRFVLDIAQFLDLGVRARRSVVSNSRECRLLGLGNPWRCGTQSPAWPSIVYRQRIQAAPKVPGGHRAERRPGIAADLARLGARHWLAAEVFFRLMPLSSPRSSSGSTLGASGGRSGTSPPSSGRCRGWPPVPR